MFDTYGNQFMMYNLSYILMIPAILLTLYASSKIRSTYQQYSQVGNERNITGAQAARFILDNANLNNVRIERVAGNLTDHYDPRAKVLRLSEGVHDSTSIAAVGVASHEVGHALQDAQNYGPLKLRSMIVPFASIGGNLGMTLVMIGLAASYYGNGNSALVNIGMLLFSATVLFQLITLPVEFDASRRALNILNSGILTPSELNGSRKVLSAAALTYVAAALGAILTFLRLFLMSRSGRRRN